MPNSTISALMLSLSLVLPAIAGAQTPPTQTPPAPQTPPTMQAPPSSQTPPSTTIPPPQQTPAQEPTTPPVKQEPPKAEKRAGTPKLYVSANVGYQFTSAKYGARSQFTIYDEPATLESSGKLKSGLGGGASAAYKLTPSFGVSVGFSTFSSKSDATVLAHVPHPVFFDQIRVASYTASALKTSAPALHIDAVWFVPFTTSLDFTISAGPSVVFVSQEVVTSANLLPEVPPFSTPQIDTVTVTKESKTTVGFNVGADAIYALNQQFGVGATLRYVFAKAAVPGLTDKLNVGGLQVLGGVRMKF